MLWIGAPGPRPAHRASDYDGLENPRPHRPATAACASVPVYAVKGVAMWLLPECPGFWNWVFESATGIRDLLWALFLVVAIFVGPIGVSLAWRRTSTGRQGHLTDRYQQAVEQLGHERLAVRLGGIYALERLMKDSPADQRTIVEVLCAFIRQSKPDKDERPSENGEESVPLPDEVQPITADAQAALDVVLRRNRKKDFYQAKGWLERLGEWLMGPVVILGVVLGFIFGSMHGLILGAILGAIIGLILAVILGLILNLLLWAVFGKKQWSAEILVMDLRGAHLVSANLRAQDLTKADLTYANLTRADMRRTKLLGARFWGASITGADLAAADLTGANLLDAELIGANLTESILVGANLVKAKLIGARIPNADLTGADLSQANLSIAYLYGADLTGAYLVDTDLFGANLWNTKLHGTFLANVRVWRASPPFCMEALYLASLQNRDSDNLPDAKRDFLKSMIRKPGVPDYVIEFINTFLSPSSYQDNEDAWANIEETLPPADEHKLGALLATIACSDRTGSVAGRLADLLGRRRVGTFPMDFFNRSSCPGRDALTAGQRKKLEQARARLENPSSPS